MKAILKSAQRISVGIGLVEDWLAIAFVVALGAVVNLQIFSRYLFNAPFIWPEEVSRILMIWIAFIGSSAVTRRGADMAVDTFVLMLPQNWQRTILIVKDLVMAGLFVFVAIQGKALAQAVASMPLIATGWPTAIMAWPLVIGSLLIAFHSLVRVADLVVLGSEPRLAPKTLT